MGKDTHFDTWRELQRFYFRNQKEVENVNLKNGSFGQGESGGWKPLCGAARSPKSRGTYPTVHQGLVHLQCCPHLASLLKLLGLEMPPELKEGRCACELKEQPPSGPHTF